MIEVKTFEDGKTTFEAEGDAAYVVTVREHGDDVTINSKIRVISRQKVDTDTLFDSIASSIAEHIVNLCPSDKEACNAIAWFMGNIKQYGVQYLTEKYGEKEETEGGSIED